jgi:hypothetical protein
MLCRSNVAVKSRIPHGTAHEITTMTTIVVVMGTSGCGNFGAANAVVA